LCCIVCSATLVLFGVIRGLIRQATLEHAQRLGANSQQGALPGSCARGLGLAPLLRACAMGLLRDEPQGRVREPMAAVGTPHGRELREFVETGAACAAPDVEARQFAALCAVRVCADLTAGGQERRSRGLAEARPRPKPREVPPRRQERKSLREPQVLWGQRGSQSVRQGFQRKRVAPGWGGETATLGSPGVERRPWLAVQVAAATPGLPRLQTVSLARAPAGLWRWLAWKKPPRGGRRQGLAHGMHRRQRAVHGGSSLVAPLAAPCLAGHVPPPQAGGGRACRSTGNGQKALARS
jgi:hypothetical protein